MKEESNQDSVLVFWRYDPNLTTIPTFTSDLLSVYKISDRDYNRLNKDNSYLLIGTNNIRSLTAAPRAVLPEETDREVNIDRVKVSW